MTTTKAESEVRVLSTLNEDGSRRWIKPWVSRGRFLTRRRVVAYALIAIFTILPYLRINGRPTILLNIAAREFTFFGVMFYPTDTLPLALLLLSVFVTVFFLTAIFGRVWCGWGCPQTVYMEFLYRPIERLFEGAPGRAAKRGAWRKPAKYAVFLLCSMFLAHIFLAYFVGVEQLASWIRTSPIEHPTAFLVMAGTTALMMFDFSFFREQMCLVACPYGRFQSVMLDRQSLIIMYDAKRGEPRGRLERGSSNTDRSLPVLGDCVDCGLCVRTCPTGIDIRDGLQMECIGCAQCIDACDSVMRKIHRPNNLIRYSSHAALEGRPARLLRPRVVLYTLLLAALLTGLTVSITSRAPADITFTRGVGLPFVRLPGGLISNQLRIKLRNRTQAIETYTVELVNLPGGQLETAERPITVAPGAAHEVLVTVIAPAATFARGAHDAKICVSDSTGYSRVRSYRLLGPWSAPPDADDHDDDEGTTDRRGEQREGIHS